jgi:hypothetical protein
MRIVRAGLALSFAIALGCHKREKAPAPASDREAQPAAVVDSRPTVRGGFSEKWLAGLQMWEQPVAAEPEVEADPPGSFDLTWSSAHDVDDDVRYGAERLLDRATLQALGRPPAGRAALAQQLAAIALPGPIDDLDPRTIRLMNDADVGRFMSEVAALRRTTPTSVLHDLDPESLLGSRRQSRGGWRTVSPDEF